MWKYKIFIVTRLKIMWKKNKKAILSFAQSANTVSLKQLDVLKGVKKRNVWLLHRARLCDTRFMYMIYSMVIIITLLCVSYIYDYMFHIDQYSLSLLSPNLNTKSV